MLKFRAAYEWLNGNEQVLPLVAGVCILEVAPEGVVWQIIALMCQMGLLHPVLAQLCVLLHGIAGVLLQIVNIGQPALLPCAAVILLHGSEANTFRSAANKILGQPDSDMPGWQQPALPAPAVLHVLCDALQVHSACSAQDDAQEL